MSNDIKYPCNCKHKDLIGGKVTDDEITEIENIARRDNLLGLPDALELITTLREERLRADTYQALIKTLVDVFPQVGIAVKHIADFMERNQKNDT